MNFKTINARKLIVALAVCATSVAATSAFAHNLRVWNKSSGPITLGQFHSANYQDVLDYTRTLNPGDSWVFTYGNGYSGFLAPLRNGSLAPYSSRLEFYGEADNSGRSSNNISYVVGRNVAMTIDDGHGMKLGDLNHSVARNAPGNIQYPGPIGPGIIGWYDGQTWDRVVAGNYLDSALGNCPGGYIRPDDDATAGQRGRCNPMTMAWNTSDDYYIDLGNP